MLGMSQDRKKPGWILWATVAFATVANAYYGAYLLMADYPEGFSISGDVLAPQPLLQPRYVIGNFDLDQLFWKKIFRPAYFADQRIRPEKWKIKNWR